MTNKGDTFTIEKAIRDSWIPRDPEQLNPSIIQQNVRTMLNYRGCTILSTDKLENGIDIHFETFAPCIYFSYSSSSPCGEWYHHTVDKDDKKKEEKKKDTTINGVVVFVGTSASMARIKIAIVRNIVELALVKFISHVIVIGKQINKKNRDAVVAEQQSKIRLELFATEFFEVNLFSNVEYLTLQPILLTIREMKAKTASTDDSNIACTDANNTDPMVEYLGGIAGQFIQLRQPRYDGGGVHIEFARIINEQKVHDDSLVTNFSSSIPPTPQSFATTPMTLVKPE